MNQIILVLALLSGLLYILHYIFSAFNQEPEEIVNMNFDNFEPQANPARLSLLNKVKRRKDDYLHNIIKLKNKDKFNFKFSRSKGKISIRV